ncbi:MAG: hypothetical protein PF481_06920 [Bacteroidales bacterium]|jgi:hypothetical protein|nr:hypothetical protein [Bacteroidales bacterium]
MAFTVDSIKAFIRLGGNIKVHDTYSVDDLISFARLAKQKKTQLTIVAQSLNFDSVKSIIRIGKQYVTIEL